MTQKLNETGRQPRRVKPDTSYNDMGGTLDVSSRTSNLGAQQVRGQVLPHQSTRKIDENIPQDAIDGLDASLAARELTANKDVPGGYAPLDTNAQLPLTNLPLPLTQANTHASPDTDSASSALHHTLGSSPNQAAAGNHVHVVTLALSSVYYSGSLIITVGNMRLPIESTYTILGVRMTVNTAPIGADIIVDVNKSGSTIFTTAANRPRIAAGSTNSGMSLAPDITTLAAGDYLSFDIDQVGSGTAGADLTIAVVVSKAIS